MSLKYIFILFIASVIGAGCNLVNPKEQIPTYIKIDSLSFSNPNPSVTGSASHKITSVWVYYENSPVGVFWLPATIPILAEKAGNITISPGISFDGMKDQQSRYQFYQWDTISFTPAPGTVVQLTPHTTYNPNTKFRSKDDFEITVPYEKIDTNTAVTIVRTTDPAKVFEGSASGYIHLTSTDTFCEVMSNDYFVMPYTGQSFVEFDYKSDVTFQVALAAQYSDGSIVKGYDAYIRPHADSWNKFYLGTQTFVVGNSSAPIGYRVIIRAILDNGNSDGYLLLDNIKVISE